jgi:Zn-dependent peptidase ImmA (M78 family)
MVPIRALGLAESLQIAELQATKLRELTNVQGPALPEAAIAELPYIQVQRMFPAVSSGASQWSKKRWLILLKANDPPGRQRFSLAHEFKHVLDSPLLHIKNLYPQIGAQSSRTRREAVCDFFAACLLMPRVELKNAWSGGLRDISALAGRFEVSRQAMEVRLVQLGLTPPGSRHLTLGVNPS